MDDPVISETPIFLSETHSDKLVVFQYPTRKNPASNATSEIEIKPETKVVTTTMQNQIPSTYIDTSNSTSSQTGLKQLFRGILHDTQSRLAVAEHTDSQIILHLVPQSSQLRPYFAPPVPDTQPVIEQKDQQLRSVQMSVKSTNQETPRHSSVLEFWRQVDKEEQIKFKVTNEPTKLA